MDQQNSQLLYNSNIITSLYSTFSSFIYSFIYSLIPQTFMVLGSEGTNINKTDTAPAIQAGRWPSSCDLHAFTHMSPTFMLYLHKLQHVEYLIFNAGSSCTSGQSGSVCFGALRQFLKAVKAEPWETCLLLLWFNLQAALPSTSCHRTGNQIKCSFE